MNAKHQIPKPRRKLPPPLLLPLLTVIAAVAFTAPARAQTTAGILTQQMLSKVNFNPAAVRPDPFFEATLFGRAQWLGFTDAPKTIMLNASGYMPEIKSSVSGSILGETFGRTFTLVAKVGYAYHVHLGRMNYLSFGLNADFFFKTIGKNAVLADPGDPSLNNQKKETYKPDVDFGMVLTLRDFQMGVSATNLVAWAYDKENDYFATRDAYYLFFQYNGNVSPKFGIDPYICVSYANDVTPDFSFKDNFLKYFKVDASLRFRILDLFWFGGGYRYNDAAYAMAGVKIGKAFTLGYSYDFGLGSMRKQHSGSHEIFLNLRFETTRKPAESSDTPLMFE